MNCTHLEGAKCLVATRLCGFSSETTTETCEACSRHDKPQRENIVTLGLATVAIHKNGKKLSDFPDIENTIKSQLPSRHGAGTELKKIIEWFPIPQAAKKKNCGRCKSLELRMNKWGCDVCDTTKRPFIIAKLMISAKRAGIPTTEFAVGLLLDRAIHNARKNNV